MDKLIRRALSHVITGTITKWENNKWGQFVYFEKQNASLYEMQHYTTYTRTLRFIETTPPDPVCWKYPENEWALKCPITAEGFIVFYLSCHNDKAADIYNNYYYKLRELYVSLENKKPDAYKRNLNDEFYIKHIAEEKERVVRSQVLFAYLTKEQGEIILTYVDNYFEYIKKECPFPDPPQPETIDSLLSKAIQYRLIPPPYAWQ